jgi:hypothetical protein
MNNQLAKQLHGAAGGLSINAPAQVRALPPAQLQLVEHIFVNALHPVLLSAAIVALVGTLVTLALPNKALQGAPAPADGDEAAADLEAKVGAF